MKSSYFAVLASSFILPFVSALQKDSRIDIRAVRGRDRRSAGQLNKIPAMGPVQPQAAPTDNKVSIQMFQWNYDSVGEECERFIGPAGYGFVEVGSLAEHVTGDQWWTAYQVVSYKLQSKYGNRDQFANMVRRCKNAGVGVMVDVIINHMSGGGDTPSSGFAGSTYTHYDYPGLYSSADFHDCPTPDRDIAIWGDMNQLWNCELSNLADLATNKEYVQQKIAGYLNDLLDLGAAGFRVDAASLIDPNDVTAIFKLLKSSAYVTQEAPGARNYLDITKNGDYQEFKLSEWFWDDFRKNDLLWLLAVSERQTGWCPNNKAVVFVANHDRERNGGLSYKTPDLLELAHVFMLGWNYGTPQVLSSYEFQDPNDGGPNGLYGTCDGNKGTNGWICQHRWLKISPMVDFYNRVRGTEIMYRTMGSRAQIAWGRGDRGHVVINSDPYATWTNTFITQLPDGEYCDVLHGAKTNNDCPGLRIKVSSSTFTVTVPPRDAVAMHIGSMVQ